ANAGAAAPGMANDPVHGPFVTIPTVSLNRPDGLAIVGQLGGGVNASIAVNPAIRAGADALDRARLFAPFPVAPGSSISHYDSIARRNLLMEPAINGDLTHNVRAPDDLTLELFRDVGWFPDADLDGVDSGVDCEPNSNLAPTVVIDGCDSGVTNTLFSDGCTISDLIAHIAANSSKHSDFVKAVVSLTNQLKRDGVITEAQKDAIVECAGSANIP
ncbi:MAG TPA: hypothetical protein VJM12_05370, partial [Pyrinomonadaceae bacterium]|nr:hypothetical protein [Pyrinomonadaceae bacterium]